MAGRGSTFASQVSAISPLADTIDGTQPVKLVRPKRAPRPRVKREVTNGIVCFCGERFSEARALEFMLHLRAEVGEVLSWVEREKERRRRDDKLTRQRALALPREQIPIDQHGKPAGYDRYGCRCERCRTARTERERARRGPRPCACGCGEMTLGGTWKKGHNNVQGVRTGYRARRT